ncbi:MAG TPA: DUF937 domain-containing protein [Aeromicrobium sp.]|jgi:hypothetical protein|nr:DUF937 domain-containing protein [Aeromicrobium sp.]HKY57059.1 DUF937 domain-containing protein [Aeromicrobium sp.]
MSDIDSLLKAIPLDQVASLLGVDAATAQAAVETAVPTILAGLQHEAATDVGAGNLAEAVGSKDPSILDGLSLDQIDIADGEKILGHVFGGNQQDVTSAVAQQLSGADVLGSVLGSILGGGNVPQAPAPSPPDATSPGAPTTAGSELAKKLLPLLAPIILAWLAQQATEKGGQINRSNGGLLQEILGGLLSGAGQGAGNRSTGSVVTDILGQILRNR